MTLFVSSLSFILALIPSFPTPARSWAEPLILGVAECMFSKVWHDLRTAGRGGRRPSLHRVVPEEMMHSQRVAIWLLQHPLCWWRMDMFCLHKSIGHKRDVVASRPGGNSAHMELSTKSYLKVSPRIAIECKSPRETVSQLSRAHCFFTFEENPVSVSFIHDIQVFMRFICISTDVCDWRPLTPSAFVCWHLQTCFS